MNKVTRMTGDIKTALHKRIIMSLYALVSTIAVLVSVFTAGSAVNKKNDVTATKKNNSSKAASPTDDRTEMVTRGEYTLDANYKRLLLVNANNPLPEDYKYGWNLTKIDSKYHNGQLDQIDAGIWPYMKAMIEAAWKDGVDLKVWSPYRSYDTQRILFYNRVKKENGDEAKAATAVARPGTSEHNTALCADFNMANSRFENTEMFDWLCKNAEDYGFILRYPKDRINITGVMYESWHWRFVGINAAKEINNLNVTLEEYVLIKKLNPQDGLYKDPISQ
ncbi:MAG: M15 family metallopeptidase [Clostridia bacterium]|nr:M15 family metallopeptidase [Clostridia bacterium]